MTTKIKTDFDKKVEKLLLASQAGCEKSTAELYKTTKPLLMSYLQRFKRNEHDREDILQNVFLSLQKNKTYDCKKCNPMAFMFMITQRKAIDALRTEKAYKRHTITCNLEENHQSLASENVAINEKYEEFYKVCLQIGKIDDDFLRLHFVHNYTYEQIALIYNLNVNTVKTRFCRAFRRVRKFLGESYENNK